MIVTSISLKQDESRWTLSARVIAESGRIAAQNISFSCPKTEDHGLTDRADPFLALMLVPCLMLGERLVIEGAVSPRLLANVRKIQDIYGIWKGRGRIEVTADKLEPAPANDPRNRIGCFFSGGVDSFYSSLKHRDRITHFILIRGFDAAMRNETVWNATRADARQVAEAEGKILLEVATNIREFTDSLIWWGDYSGSVLGAIALLFSHLLRVVIVPSGQTYAEQILVGTHPLIEPALHNEAVSIEFDGCEASRYEKVRYISQSELALGHLRVCWSPRTRVYNCGRCEKCLRTMMALEAAGALERCGTFPKPINRSRLRRIRYARPAFLDYAMEFREPLMARNPAIGKILDRVIAKSRKSIAGRILEGHYR